MSVALASADHAAATEVAAAPPPPAETTTIHIARTLLAPSPTNPRKRFNPARVTEIAASMREVGQIQPILVRPHPTFTPGSGRPTHEIVVGETRWRAAGEAPLEHLDCTVRHLTDAQALKIQLIENLQREDLHPLEEAEGYELLLHTPDGCATVDELAAAVGKSRGYVYGRLKLCALGPTGREAFYAGTLTASVALLIARMPDARQQDEATARIVQGFGGEPYSFRSAAEYLQKTFMLRLDKARFSLADAYQVAPPCNACSKRSGAAPDLFQDVTSGDMCQDSQCYQAKADEHHARTLQAAREAGHQVVDVATEARRLLPAPGMDPVAGYHKLDKPCPELTDSKRPLRDLLTTNGALPKGLVVLDHPGADDPVWLVPEALAKKALKARNLLRAPGSPSQANTDGKPVKPGKTGTADQLTMAQSMKVLMHTRNVHFGRLLFAALHQALREAEELPTMALREVLLKVFDVATSAEGGELICKARQLSSAAGHNQLKAFAAYTETCTPRELGELLVECAICEDLSDGAPPEDLQGSFAIALAESYGIDLVALDQQAGRAAVEEMNAKSGSAAKDATAAFLAAHAPLLDSEEAAA